MDSDSIPSKMKVKSSTKRGKKETLTGTEVSLGSEEWMINVVKVSNRSTVVVTRV